jgi:DNA-binding HxlR family transcriptional regulator
MKDLPWPTEINPRVEKLATEVIGRVADKWTMVVLDVLAEHGELRFSKLAALSEGISQKMLTQTVRAMERDGLVIRTIHPVVPPRVEYKLTDLGFSLAEAFCGVWIWAAANLERIHASRDAFDSRKAP